ncbi:sialate:O-sulfotransferase 2-like [Crassostrea virginica]
MNWAIFFCLASLLCGIESVHYEYVGCLQDRASRILREKAAVLKPNSPWHCQRFCAGYTYFGVEYGAQCFCGNKIVMPIRASSKCTMSCAQGSNLLLCGGGWAIDVYRRTY